jgi:glycosyltransferase involved in cell wall biosynthesis
LRDEEANVLPLHAELTSVFQSLGRPYEVILVEDGSADQTLARLREVQQGDPHVRVIGFTRKFGQTAAFAAGFAAARGRLIITADGDLQNDLADIPHLVRFAESHDIVCGWRRRRQDAFLTRRVPSIAANWLLGIVSGIRLHDNGCSLKVFRAEVVKPLRLYGEMHRFLPAIASEMGVRIVQRPVNHRARVHGRSKYGISRTVRVILDLITVKFLLSYSTRPLQMFGLLGMGMGLAGAAISAYLAYLRLFGHQSIADRPLLLLGILLIFTGFQLLTLGLLAELQIRTYHESQDKPTYVIREVLDASARDDEEDREERAAIRRYV